MIRKLQSKIRQLKVKLRLCYRILFRKQASINVILSQEELWKLFQGRPFHVEEMLYVNMHELLFYDFFKSYANSITDDQYKFAEVRMRTEMNSCPEKFKRFDTYRGRFKTRIRATTNEDLMYQTHVN